MSRTPRTPTRGRRQHGIGLFSALAVVYLLAMASASWGQTTQSTANSSAGRESLEYVQRDDGTRLTARVFPGTVEHNVIMGRSEGDLKPSVWTAHLPIPIPPEPNKQAYYLLVKLGKDRTTVFLTWDPQYYVIDEATGLILEHGKGDAVLKGYSDWVPLRLRILGPQVEEKPGELTGPLSEP